MMNEFEMMNVLHHQRLIRLIEVYDARDEMTLITDFVYAADTARFALTEITLGIMPGSMGTQTLPRAVGQRRAMEIILCCDDLAPFAQRYFNLISNAAEIGVTAKNVRCICCGRQDVSLHIGLEPL